MSQINRQFTLAARPTGLPSETDFKLIESPMPTPQSNQLLAKTLYLSVDPYMRGRMNDVKSYAPPVQLGEVMTGGSLSLVTESNHPDFKEGDIVEGRLGWQEYAISDGKDMRKIDPDLAPITTALGVLGMPGMTAYFGLLEICQPKAGETVVVSGAAGAVGSLVGQIAKIKGCRAVGIARSDEKISYLVDDLGFDGGFNYRTSENLRSSLASLCPNGIDVYFDNVGGKITDAVMGLINPRARVSVCGQISQYNLEKPEMGPRWLGILVRSQVKMEGFLVFQFQDRFETGLREMAQWIREGKLKYQEDIMDGFENTPKAFIMMLQGANTGKQLVKVAEV